MKVSIKYLIEFSAENTTEIIAICDSVLLAKEYLKSKFMFEDSQIKNDEGCLLVVTLDYGKIKVRKVDFVGD